MWSEANRFTGWEDVPLTDVGTLQTREVGKLLRTEGIHIDYAFSSVLVRSSETVNILLDVMKQHDVPTMKSWKLNERHYGALQGLYKNEIADKYGEDQVFLWRRSFDVRPPGVDISDERHPGNDPMYVDIKKSLLPNVETLSDVVARVIPFWREFVVPELRQGKTVLIAAHGNTVRALIKYLDNVPDDEIAEYDIPYAIPLLYEFNDQMEVVSSRYLGDAEKVKETILAIQKQGKID